MDEPRWREERGRKIQDMKEASGQKELTEADVAAAQKEPTGGKPRMAQGQIMQNPIGCISDFKFYTSVMGRL